MAMKRSVCGIAELKRRLADPANGLWQELAAILPLGCAVAETSGHWALDNATCAAMLNKGRFESGPAAAGGRQYWTSPRISWVLPE